MLQTIPLSPCIKLCVLDEHGFCRGCYRTIQEISAWPRLSMAQQRLMLGVLERRGLQRAAESTVNSSGDL